MSSLRTTRSTLYLKAGIAAFLLGAAAAVFVFFSISSRKASEVRQASLQDPLDPPGPTIQLPPPPPLDYRAIERDAWALMRALLSAADPQARREVVRFLGEARHRESVAELRQCLSSDPDPMVQCLAAWALAEIGAAEAKELLLSRYPEAKPSMQVWLASALWRLSHKEARTWLEELASAPDLAVAVPGALALADISQRGDKAARSALKALLARVGELPEPSRAEIAILAKLAKLGDVNARNDLYKALDRDPNGHSEDIQLTIAKALAELGDDTGKEVLRSVLGDAGSPNRVLAATVLVLIGDYSGYELLLEEVASGKRPELVKLCAAALGQVAEQASLRPLLGLYTHQDRSVRVAAAAAVLWIVALDPKVLAADVVNWVDEAIRSPDARKRRDAARVLPALPEDKAIARLSMLSADGDATVRREAAQSAVRAAKSIQGARKAAKIVTHALAAETVAEVKEAQVRSLAVLGRTASSAETVAEVKAALERVAGERDRVGVLALGSLIAIGVTDAMARLERAYRSGKPAIRLAVMESAVVAASAIVLPILERGLRDAVAAVRRLAAEGLAFYRVRNTVAVELLKRAAVGQTESAGRAGAALARLGEAHLGAPEAKELLGAEDMAQRRAALSLIAEAPWQDAAPLLRLSLADPAAEVRREAIEVLGALAASQPDRDEVVRMYRPLMQDEDDVVRIQAKAALAVLLPPVPTLAAEVKAVDLRRVESAAKAVQVARREFDQAQSALDGQAREIADKTRRPPRSEAEMEEVEGREEALVQAFRHVEAAHGRLMAEVDLLAAEVDAVAREASGVAERSPELAPGVSDQARAARQLIEEARRSAGEVEVAWEQAGKRTAAVRDELAAWVDENIAGDELYCMNAETALAQGNLAAALRDLRRAEAIGRESGKKNPCIDYVYGMYYEERAGRATGSSARARDLGKAKESYERFAARGAGDRVELATERAAELTTELEQ